MWYGVGVEVDVMSRDWARAFYSSQVWEDQREAYKRYAHGICERCGEPGVIVHHVRPLTEDNIADPAYALDFANLMLLCRQCHADVHEGIYGRKRPKDTGEGMRFDRGGELVPEVPPQGEGRWGAALPNRGPWEKPTGRTGGGVV